MLSSKTNRTIRNFHRWLGFFLAGIMALYASSGVLLIFRGTDFLKYEQTHQHQLDAGLSGDDLGKRLRLKGFRVIEDTGTVIIYREGQYDKQSGVASVTKKDYPAPVAKIVNMHKATTRSPLYYFNIFFGVSLLFFSVSAFLMFAPKLPLYKNGLKIAFAGFAFALLIVLLG